MKNTGKNAIFRRTILTEQTLSHTLGSPLDERPSELVIPAWISQELLDRTCRAWAKEYGKILTQADAVEILENLRQLGEVLIRASADDG